MRSIFSVIVLSLVLSGCGGGGGGSDTSPVVSVPTPTPVTPPTVDPRQAFIDKAYDTSYSVPANFRADRSEPILHLLNEATNIEMCADQEYNFHYEVQRRYGATGGRTDTTYDTYFEAPIYIGNDEVYVRMFECGTFDREGGVALNEYGYGGQINPNIPVEGLNAITVDIFEYLFTIRDWGTSFVKVLETELSEDANSYTHKLKLVSVTPNATGCDSVVVGQWQFRADKADKRTVLDFVKQDVFEAEFTNGTASICE